MGRRLLCCAVRAILHGCRHWRRSLHYLCYVAAGAPRNALVMPPWRERTDSCLAFRTCWRRRWIPENGDLGALGRFANLQRRYTEGSAVPGPRPHLSPAAVALFHPSLDPCGITKASLCGRRRQLRYRHILTLTPAGSLLSCKLSRTAGDAVASLRRVCGCMRLARLRRNGTTPTWGGGTSLSAGWTGCRCGKKKKNLSPLRRHCALSAAWCLSPATLLPASGRAEGQAPHIRRRTWDIMSISGVLWSVVLYPPGHIAAALGGAEFVAELDCCGAWALLPGGLAPARERYPLPRLFDRIPERMRPTLPSPGSREYAGINVRNSRRRSMNMAGLAVLRRSRRIQPHRRS